MNKTMYVMIGVIVILLVVVFICASNPMKMVNGVNNTVTNTSVNSNGEKKTNVAQVNEVKTQNTTESENRNEITNSVSSETFTEDVQTEEQKAINIVRKDYGNTGSNTKISVDGISENGSYIIVVRDSSTTKALAYYTVNVQTGEFTKKEVF